MALEKCVVYSEKKKIKLFKPTKYGGDVALAYAITWMKEDEEKLKSVQAMQKALGFAACVHTVDTT